MRCFGCPLSPLVEGVTPLAVCCWDKPREPFRVETAQETAERERARTGGLNRKERRRQIALKTSVQNLKNFSAPPATQAEQSGDIAGTIPIPLDRSGAPL